MEKEKLVVVDFYEYMSLLENYRKLDIKCRDLQKSYDDKVKIFCNILSAIGEFEDRKLTKTEFFYLINEILIEQGVKDNG